MLTFFLFLTLAVLFVLVVRLNSSSLTEETLSTSKAVVSTPREAEPFETFCQTQCRCRFFCLRKQIANQKRTCFEFELASNALW